MIDDQHPGTFSGESDIVELLDAHLDGELTADEQVRVDLALASSDELRRHRAELAAVRTLVRSLPEVVPAKVAVFPSDETDTEAPVRIADAPSRRRRRVLVPFAAAAAVWLVVLVTGVAVGRIPVVPDVDTFAVRHASAQPLDFVAIDEAAMDDPAVLADIGHGMARDGVFGRDGVVQTRYSDGAHALSLFHETGEVDWDAMPETGTITEMPDGPMWQSAMNDTVVVVVERGDLVVTVVSDAEMGLDLAMEASAQVPLVQRNDSMWRRLWTAPSNLLQRF